MRDRTPVQSLAALVGLVFLLVGILGFIPGITTHYSDLASPATTPSAKLLGIFQTRCCTTSSTSHSVSAS